MKQCPACKTTYTDESLRYCLADGTVLTSETEEPTVVRPDHVRVDIPKGDSARPKSKDPDARRRMPTWQKTAIVFVIIGIVFAAAVILMAGVLYMNTGRGVKSQNNSSTSVPSPSPTTDAEKQRLQDELANLQRKIDEQKNANRQAANADPFPTQSQPGIVTARVNSPNDGFLALRNIPDAEYGERLAKIPHGATVTINNCEKNKVSIAGRGGRWCQVEYSGQTGWVFDAWLIY